MPVSDRSHWDRIYSQNAEEEVSWFQPYPKTSMEFVDLFHLPPEANIIDIGGGDSHFADALLDRSYQHIWVLDISASALERAKQRLGKRALKVHWILTDVTRFEPPVQFDLWHDRAAFHFLTTRDRINKYVSIAEKAIKKNGYLVLGTFSENGPKKCSGLDIKQYSEPTLSVRWEASFTRIKCIHQNHITPFHTSQDFLFCSFLRK